MSKEEDKIFFRNFSLALGLIAAMMVMFFIVAQFAGSDTENEARSRAKKVAEVTKPVGQVTVAGGEVAEEEVAALISKQENGHPGEAVYNGLCVNCHSMPAMAAMIPQTGGASAWKSRIEKGMEVLYDNAINGFVGELGMMPAKGGDLNLSDSKVKAAVDYIISQVETAAITVATTGDATTTDNSDQGKQVYEGLCVNCHSMAAMAAMIPQTNDPEAWKARIEKGIDALHNNAINGLGMMPAKGGNPSLSDDEVKAAVNYMIKQTP